MNTNAMKTTIRHVATTIIACLSVFACAGAHAEADSECTTKGGKTHCPPPRKFPETFSSCDTGPDNALSRRVWCESGGGQWVSDTLCLSPAPVPTNRPEAESRFMHFLIAWHPSVVFCTGPGISSATEVYGTLNCGESTGPKYINGILTERRTLESWAGVDMDYNATPQSCSIPWSTGLEIVEGYPLDCDASHIRRTGIDGSRECTVRPPCKTCVGNPVDVGNGQKRERATDYASAAPGGLSFVRHFNSGGFFDAVSRHPVNTDYWRHNYSATIIAYPGNAYEMAASIRPAGDVLHFNLSGGEIQNSDGAANRLQKLVDAGGALTGWRLTTPESDVELYDAQGRLTSVTTRAGFVTTLAYNAQGRLTTVTDAYARSLTLSYDASGQLVSMTDPASRVYQYGYDASGRLSTVTYPDTRVRTYVYENASWPWLLTGIIDERGIRFSTYSYDSFGMAVSTEHSGPDDRWAITGRTYGGAQVTALDAFNYSHTYYFSDIGGVGKLTRHQGPAVDDQYAYDANGNRTSHTNLRGKVTTYAYDAARNLETSRTEASGTSVARTITTTWHPTFRLPATITEPSGVSGVNLVTAFTYDANGNLTKKKLTAGTSIREWNYTVNARGQLLTIDGPRTDVTDVSAITYYADNDTCVGCRGQVQTVTNAAGQVTAFNSYDLDGHPTQITDANGVVTTLAYTPRGWLASRTAAGETTAYDYDFAGNLSKVTLPDGSWVTYQYDAANGLVGLNDNLMNSIDYVLDVKGNRVQESVFDPQGQLRRIQQSLYDSTNRLQKVLGAAGQTTTYGYAPYDNFSTVTDPLLRLTTNYTDVLGRLSSTTDPANGSTTFTYDAKDRLTSVKDPRNLTTTYTYDSLGNLTQQVSPDTGTTGFTYDAAGNVATQTDARSVATTYAYDALNRVVSATVADGTVTYEYDNTTTGGPYARGRLTKVTDPSGNTTWTYDSLGRVTAKTQTVTAAPANKAFTTGYTFSQGRQTGITYPSGRVVTYGFNAAGRVSAISVDGAILLSAGEYFPFGGPRKWLWANGETYERTFDLDGRLKSVTLGPSTGTYADLSQTFGYDSLNRLNSANLAAGQTQSYAYDANGNRTNATINAASTTYTYPGTSHKLSSLSGATTRSFTYDNAGNVTASAGITYAYDGRGRLKQAGSATYLVNGLGQRVRKNAGSDTYFAYDEAGRLVGEYDAAGAVIQELVWLGDIPVATMRPKQPSGYDVYYVWSDNLNSPRAVSDAANQLRWAWDPNDPFGKTAPNENPASVGAFAFNLRFPGQYFDTETGTHYNYFRLTAMA